MRIEMSYDEFQGVRKFITNLKQPNVTKAFNEVFASNSAGRITGFAVPIDSVVYVDVPDDIMIPILKVLSRNAHEIGLTAKDGVSLTNAPKLLCMIKELYAQIRKALKR